MPTAKRPSYLEGLTPTERRVVCAGVELIGARSVQAMVDEGLNINSAHHLIPRILVFAAMAHINCVEFLQLSDRKTISNDMIRMMQEELAAMGPPCVQRPKS